MCVSLILSHTCYLMSDRLDSLYTHVLKGRLSLTTGSGELIYSILCVTVLFSFPFGHFQKVKEVWSEMAGDSRVHRV